MGPNEFMPDPAQPSAHHAHGATHHAKEVFRLVADSCTLRVESTSRIRTEHYQKEKQRWL